MTLKEAEVLALSTLKQVMEEKVRAIPLRNWPGNVCQADLPICAGLMCFDGSVDRVLQLASHVDSVNCCVCVSTWWGAVCCHLACCAQPAAAGTCHRSAQTHVVDACGLPLFSSGS